MAPDASSPAPSLDGLMERFRRTGDPEALGALFDATAPGLFRLALTLVHDPAAAEDAVQETFLAALEAAPRFDPARPVLPWLVGILHHKAARARERRGRAPDPRRLPPLSVPGDPARLAGDREEEERVRAALDGLPEPYREVALLRWRHGLEPAEIAALKRTSPGTIRSHLHRALEKVRRRMAALPALLFAGTAGRVPRGLDAVRRAILGNAGAGAQAAGVVGGILMAKKVMAAALCLLAAAGAWRAISGGSSGGNPTPAGPAHGTGGTRIADGTGIRVLAPRPEASAPPPPVAGGRSEGKERGFATGVVVDRGDEPVAGALIVSLQDTLPGPTAPSALLGPGGAGRGARTDGKGRFRVPLPAASAPCTIYVEAEGYAPVVETEVPPRGAVLRIVLDRPATLSGRVLDPAGGPVPGASVRLLYLMDTARVERSAVSGEDGAYRIEGVPPRRRFARPLHSDAVIEVRAGGFAPLLTGLFFPPSSAIANPGEEGRLDLHLTRGVSVRGRVVDGETGAPVEGARVVLTSFEQTTVIFRPGERSFVPGLVAPRTLGEARSATDGSFRFDGLPARGKGALLCSNVGRKGLQLGAVGAIKAGWAPATDEVPVSDDGAVVETTLALWPAATVAGRVVDGEGRPVAGAGVRVEADGRAENAWFPPDLYPGVPTVAGTTDAEGRYRVEGVRARRDGASSARVLAVRSGSVLLNQPGGLSIEVMAGRTTDAPDLVLEGPPDAALSFLVVDAGGNPVGGALVAGEMQAFTGRTGPDGRVLLRSPIHGSGYRPEAPPEIAFSIQARGYGRTRVLAAPSTTDPVEVRVVLGEAHSVSGRVRGADGTPATGTQVLVVRGDLPVEEAFEVPSASREPRGLLAWANCGEDGRFTAEDLPAGPYHLRARRSLLPKVAPGAFVIRAGGGSPFPVLEATVPGVASDAKGVEIVLPAEEVIPSETVEGTVVDAATGAPVEIRSAALLRGEDAATGGKTPGVVGAFRFAEVPAGEWTLVCQVEGYAAPPVAVPVRPGTRPAPIALRLGRGATVRGILRPPAGTALEGGKAVFVLTGALVVNRVVQVDGEGRFEAAGFLPGRYRVSVGSADSPRPGFPAFGPRDARTLEVPEGAATVPFECDVVPAGELYVKVVDARFPPAGSAAAGAGKEDQRRFGEGSRLEIRDRTGAVLEERRGLAQGWAFYGVTLPEGEYVVRLVLPGGGVREEKAVLRAGERTSVRL